MELDSISSCFPCISFMLSSQNVQQFKVGLPGCRYSLRVTPQICIFRFSLECFHLWSQVRNVPVIRFCSFSTSSVQPLPKYCHQEDLIEHLMVCHFLLKQISKNLAVLRVFTSTASYQSNVIWDVNIRGNAYTA